MTVTRGQTATGVNVNSATTAVLTFGTNPAAGAKVLVFVGGTVAPSGVVDNGTTPKTFTRDAHFTSGTFGLNDLSVWRADGITLPASGSYHVTVTFGSAAFGVTGARSYAGVATGAPSATNSGSGTSGSVATGNVTPPATGSLVFGGFVDDTGTTETITLTTSGASSVYSTGNGSIEAGAAADNIVTTTSAQGLAWTLSDAPDWAGIVAVYAAAAAPSGHGLLQVGII
jgi:hypothetical protein